MRKPLEVGIVVALSVLAVTSTATVIHDAKAGVTSPIDRVVQSGWHTMTNWLTGASRAAIAPKAESKPSKGTSAAAAKAAVASDAASADSPLSEGQGAAARGAVTFTKDDLAKAQSIAQTLMTSMTRQEWQTVLQDFLSGTPAQASSNINRILLSHLSTNDKAWLATRLGPSQGLDATDVRLLQHTVTELENTLTPDEQTMLKSEVSSVVKSLGAAQ